MSDSSWQQAVLHELGVSRRGFQTLDATPGGPGQGAWGAEAPPRPAPEQAPAAPVPHPAARPSASEVPPFTPAAEPARAATGEQAPLLPEPEPPAPQDQAAAQQHAPPEHAAQQFAAQQFAAQQATAQQVAEPAAAQQALAAQQAQQAAAEQAAAEQAAVPQPVQPVQQAQPVPDVPDGSGEPEQPEPLVHSDFDWEAAVNPVLGSVARPGDTGAPDGAARSTGAHPVADRPASDRPAAAGQPAAGHQVPAHDLVRKNRHGDPLARRMGRGVRNAMGGGAREARELAAFAELMQRPVPSSRQIAVASVRGGAGKTTMAALVATELARHRADRVLAADADAELGSLPLRLGVLAQLSLFDLATQSPHSFEEAERFLTRTAHGLYVLSSTRGGRIAGEFTFETLQTALSAVSRYVAATVVDCGAGILTEVNRSVIAGSHGLVLVTPGTVDGALSARGALEWFAANGQQSLLPRTVIAMVSHAPQVDADLHRAHQMLTAWGLPVVAVPYDRQLATGGAIDVDRVSASARMAVTRVVHEVFSRALTAGVGQ